MVVSREGYIEMELDGVTPERGAPRRSCSRTPLLSVQKAFDNKSAYKSFKPYQWDVDIVVPEHLQSLDQLSKTRLVDGQNGSREW